MFGVYYITIKSWPSQWQFTSPQRHDNRRIRAFLHDADKIVSANIIIRDKEIRSLHFTLSSDKVWL